MKARCQPGDRCLIVGDVPGCECNIGAEVTVTSRVAFVRPTAWEFKDASRPLLSLAINTDGSIDPSRPRWVTATGEPTDYEYPAYFDHHLVPLRAEGEPAIDEQPQALAA